MPYLQPISELQIYLQNRLVEHETRHNDIMISTTPSRGSLKTRPSRRRLAEKNNMKTTEQVIDFLTSKIGHVYARPLMYGGTAEGVDNILHVYHELWADIMERRDDYDSIRYRVYSEQECGSAGFATRYQLNHSISTQTEIAKYVVDQWKKVSELLGVPIPYAKIAIELKQKS